jgi:hypothetical protein
MVHELNAVTSNQTLIQWLPRLAAVSDLLAATPAQKVQPRADGMRALIRVAYQTSVKATWRGETKTLTGRTLEEAFALENLAWSQEKERAELRLRVKGSAQLAVDELFKRLHKKIKSSSFNKTDFALALLAQSPDWTVPAYIREGLEWLEEEVTPIPVEVPTANQATKIAA